MKPLVIKTSTLIAATLITAALLLGATAMPAAANSIPIPGAGGGVINAPVKSLVALRYQNMVKQSYDVSCGAAAMATILTHYYGIPISEKEVIEDILQFSTEKDQEKINKFGFSMLELKRLGERLGLVAGGFRVPDVSKLAKLEVPAIAITNVRGYAHFVVIRGVINGKVHVADPAFGNKVKDLKAFADTWNNVIMVFLSPNQTGDQAFQDSHIVKSPEKQIYSILDPRLWSIRPLPGEF